MASSLGGKREGAGRPKGSRNAYNREMERLLKDRMKELGHDDYDPVVCMAEIALDTSNPVELRFKAHAEVAQYVRSKKLTADIPETVAITLSTDQRRSRIKELSESLRPNVAAPISAPTTGPT
jgi:hypothetical protein